MQEKKVVDWYRSDLFYQKIYYLEMAIVDKISNKDMEGWYQLLEEEFRFVWPHIKNKAKKTHDREYWEENFLNLRKLLYDVRINRDNKQSERIAIRNRTIARDILHEIQLLLNDYEVSCGLRITERKLSDPHSAIKNFGQ